MSQNELKSKYPPIKGIGTLVREGLISFVRIDKEVFEKTEAERKAAKRVKLEHKRYITMCGCDPKKVLNIG
jgi:hypothetical protein